jgi:hypothetical protein
VQAPRLVGLTSAKAEKRLKEAGLSLGERKEASSEAVPAGEVVAQDPPTGEGAKRGTKVDLIVSSGPPKRGVTDRGDFPSAGGGNDRGGGSDSGGGTNQAGGSYAGGGTNQGGGPPAGVPPAAGGQYR